MTEWVRATIVIDEQGLAKPVRELSCQDAAGIVRANIARFCNEPQDPAAVAAAEKVAEAHYHGFGNCQECVES
jgi:hypothetical protein